MKKIIAILLICIAANIGAKAQFVTIPDANFKAFLQNKYPTAFNGAGLMDTTNSLILAATDLSCGFKSIASLDGVQYFNNLKTLYCKDNNLTSLPKLPSTLIMLSCDNNLLLSLPVLPNKMRSISCDYNQLTSLPIMPDSMAVFTCTHNNITSLPTLKPILKYLYCSNNPLSSLPTLPSKLQYLHCSSNQLTSLPSFSNILYDLICDYNLLTSIPSLPSTLNSMSCGNNLLTTLPILPASLKYLYCNNNQFISLPSLPSNLNTLDCSNNSTLNCLPFLPLKLLSINRSGTNVLCLPNKPTGITSSLPICNATNNPNNCPIIATPNYVNIPDTSFGKFLLTKYPSCLYKDASDLYWMDTTCGAVVGETYLNCGYYTGLKNINSIEGVQYFKNLLNLDCTNNKITSLPTLPTTIKGLYVEANLLTTLPVLPEGLKVLWCTNNQLTTLPALPDSLEYLLCSSNQLISLPALPSTITGLNCSHNLLTSLPTLPNKMDSLFCNDNVNLSCLPKLPNGVQSFFYLRINNTNIQCLPNLPRGLTTTLPICNPVYNPNNCTIFNSYLNIPDTIFGKYLIAKYPSCLYWDTLPNKYYLDTICSENIVAFGDVWSAPSCNLEGVQYFKTLIGMFVQGYPTTNPTWTKLPESLDTLWCQYTTLTSLPPLPSQLRFLYVSNNKLTSLPQLPKSLKILNCSNNLLSNISTLPDSLIFLYCDNNNIFCLPKLPNSLKDMSADFGTKINCLPNIPPAFSSIFPICNPTNNANQCLAFPHIYGKVFTDNNSNGIKDANEFYRPFVKITSNFGNATYTNASGAYAINMDSVGSYTLVAQAPPFFKALPDSNSFNIANYNATLGLPDIALQPIVTKDSLAIVTIPISNRARPGFAYAYNVGYANAGTTNLFTTTSFMYDTSRLDFDSSSTAIISHIGNTINIATDSLIAGQVGSFNLYFTVKATTAINVSIKTLATIAAPQTTANWVNATRVFGSYDPNDKQATPELSPSQLLNGDKVEYTIRFQNTGNDTAFNVVLSDTLSNLIKSGYLQVIGTSHQANITYKIVNNIFYFEFLNINLPDSATNHFASMGWVTFKVKPLQTLALGAEIDNKAHIYFDYNKDIVTNIAKTIIKQVIVPVKLVKYEVRSINETTRNQKQVTNSWTVFNEINVSHYNIQRSVDGNDFKTIGQVKATNATNYQFTDLLTFKHLPVVIYYRLMMADNDGKTDYSIIKQINLSQLTDKPINLFPNPTKNLVNIECNGAKEILIVNYLGKTVSTKKVIENQIAIFNMQGFAKGVYLVKAIMNNGAIKTEKLIVE